LRNLGLMLSNGVTLTSALRIVAEAMEATGTFIECPRIADRVRPRRQAFGRADGEFTFRFNWRFYPFNAFRSLLPEF
jgi:hypothetical protein